MPNRETWANIMFKQAPMTNAHLQARQDDNAFGKIFNTVGGAVVDAVVSHVVEPALDAAGGALNDARDAAGDALNQAGQAAGDALNQAGQAAGDAFNQAKDAAGNVLNQAGHITGDIIDQVRAIPPDTLMSV